MENGAREIRSCAIPAHKDFESTKRVTIVSDFRIFRDALTGVLSQSQSFDVAAQVCGIHEIQESGATMQSDLFLLDAGMHDGFPVLARIRSFAPDAHVVAVAVSENAGEVMEWVEAGITGYVPKQTALKEVPGMLRRIVAGEQACSARVACALIRRIFGGTQYDAVAESNCKLSLFTARERETAELICEGLRNKEIAERMKISIATVKSHVHQVLEKLEIDRRGQVAQFYQKWCHLQK